MDNQDIKEEKVENQIEREEDVNSLLPGATMISKPENDGPDYAYVIENARLDFMKKYKAGRRNSFIAMGVVLLLAVASVICITMNAMVFKIIGWSCVGTAIVGMLIYYIVTRNSLPNATKEYISVVNEQLNVRNFADTRFEEVSTDKTEKLELSDPISDAIFTNLNNIASRNVINGKFAKRTFKVGDLGLYSGQGKARSSAFVGKYISYPNDLHFEGRYLIAIKGAVPTDLPTDIEDLVVLHEEDNIVIYGKEGNKFNADLGKDFINKIKALKVENHLLNVDFAIWSGHSSIYASYDDQIMTLPYQNEYNKEPNEQYAKDLICFFEALNTLVEKEK